MSDIYVMVGQRIRFYRKFIDLTQEQLGERTGIDQSYLGRIERGEINVTLETLDKLAKALGIDAAKLLSISPEKEQPKEAIIAQINALFESLEEQELERMHTIVQQIIHFR